MAGSDSARDLLQHAKDLGAFLYCHPVQIITFQDPHQKNNLVACIYPQRSDIVSVLRGSQKALLSCSVGSNYYYSDNKTAYLLAQLIRKLEQEIGEAMHRAAGEESPHEDSSDSEVEPPTSLLPSSTVTPVNLPTPKKKSINHSRVKPKNVRHAIPQAAAAEGSTASTYDSSDDGKPGGLITPSTSTSTVTAGAGGGGGGAGEELRTILREEIDVAVRRVLKSLLEGTAEK
ncbi:hypothetical protein L873DRAFT_636233 [Choiromyces venosus 120613-1]|uniref:Uncharacterized protein n=1 Tax=Choiromyces venosus 120613-1 TaxID=1336337 RepID=A0A3N4JWN6_9PEZI|nr:hypothetical protein L873DRAFT_636233 [Choiromyces venosus 120613-1]